ncbi:MAG: glycosyltransferase family 2 protein [Candidatus Omnitrophica bacterium]|nr:glycosyltransferase family 2 protein [Candidatus Omnitrophota bacterium]MDD5430102.1 glycosyltransferase family 2 protein [Candidatus Omnitrophota bacterium]
MKFNFSRHNLQAAEQKLERFLEVIPGAISWFILIGLTVLSFVNPLAAAVIIIAFDLYWLLRLFYMNIFLVFSYSRLRLEAGTDWLQRLKGLDSMYEYWEELKNKETSPGGKKDLSVLIHKEEIRILEKSKKFPPLSQEIYHLVIVPVARESRNIIEPGVESIARGKFPASNILLVLAIEETAPQASKEAAAIIQERYAQYFYDLLVTVHPSNIPGEAKVKGANATFAARKAAAYLENKNIPFENVVVSCFDADTVVAPDYFSCLTYRFMVSPDRTQASFQPIPVYYNNIWETPAFARVLDVGSSFFQLIEATNPDRLVTFSSHSMSFKALVDVGYWPVDMVSDDSAIFWKAFVHFNGNYRVVPLYVTLSMDVTEAENWWRTAVNVYKQKRRWAWGVENFPILMRAFLQAENIPLSKRLKHSFKMLESHISWATWPFLLSIIGWLPAMFAGREFSHSILYYSAPRITGIIFSLASLGLLVCIILSILLLPKQKTKFSFFKKIGHAFEWLLVPPISIFLSALPALDAQTRLMLGKYMEFWVTVKKRK